jgi:catechol 2,3-dioxygenase-like lactoylglutathione lyase family enzyme
MLLVFLAAHPLAAHAQASPDITPAFQSTGAFFALSVADREASANWYTAKLGLKIVMRPPKADGAAVVILEGGGLIVELVELDKAAPLSQVAPSVTGAPFVHGIFKAGIIVEDFNETLAVLKSRGVDIAFGPFPARDAQRANVIIRDNAGNLIQLFGR